MNGKHRQIKSVGFSQGGVEILHQPGSNEAKVMAEWTAIPVTKASCTDKVEDNGMHTVEFSAIYTSTSPLEYMMLTELFGMPGILLLVYTDGSRCIVGDNEFPVWISIDEDDSPSVFNLRFKRVAPTGILSV